MPSTRLNTLLSTGVSLLLVTAIGAGPVLDTALSSLTLVLALGGLSLIATERLKGRTALHPPDREIKLIGFAMVFFALTRFATWMLNGLGYEGLKELANSGQLLLFWPLFVVLVRVRLQESTAFIAVLASAVLAGASVLLALLQGESVSRLTGATDAIAFANLSLLNAMLLLVAGAYAHRSGRKVMFLMALLGVALGLAAAYVSLGSDYASEPSFRPGIWQILTTAGLIGALSWALLLAIPFAQFMRLVRHESPRVAHLAMAGALVPLAYLMFGLTGAPLESGIYPTFYLVTVTTLAYLTWQAVDEDLYRHRSQKLSATIITYNEADNIAACLESLLPIADEIIVLDSGSTDDTVAIARRYTEQVEITDWPGFGIQKQRALERATGDWVLSIDADERVTPYLAREINHTLGASPSAQAYKLPWAVTIYGKRLDFGRSGRAPLRLFKREGVSFSDAQVHEKILLPDDYRVKTLRGRLTHYTHRDYGHAMEKSAQYAWLGAKQKAQKGQTTRTLLYPSFRALTTFIQVYILRLGFLDGPVGYLMAITYAQTSFNTYAGLWTLRRQALTRDDDE